MKQTSFTLLLTVLLSMLGLQAFADFDTSTKIEGYNEFGSFLYYYLDNDNNQAEVTSLSYGEYRGDIVIPSSIVVISSSTYEERTYSVTSIGRRAFLGCSGLTSITIPNSVTSIGGNAFTYCSRLTSISIPNSVTSIGGYAFSECSGLTSFTIPNSVTSIGTNPFYGCTALTSVKVASGNTIYDSRNNCDAIIETASNTLIAGCKNTVIPNSVTSIGRRAFSGCSGLTSITIPNSVTSIGYETFCGCSGLTSVTIPNSVTSIGESAFKDCSSLTSVTIPNSVTSIGEGAFDGVDIPTVISLIENPFTITGKTSSYRTFSQNTFNNATLYVPKGTIDKYKATDGWKDFAYIVESDPTGIKNIETKQLEEESYYDLDGKRIESPKSGSVVIKKAGQKAMKVVVK